MRLVSYDVHQEGDTYKVKCIPKIKGMASGGIVTMNAETFNAFWKWHHGKGLVQDIPNLSVSEREMLLSGMNDEDWQKTFGKDEEANNG